jgi:hypothetical protein
MPLTGAMLAAKVGKFGPAGYAFATILALLLGAASAWTMWKVRAYLQSLESLFAVVYATAMLWIALEVALGYWVTSLVVRSFA